MHTSTAKVDAKSRPFERHYDHITLGSTASSEVRVKKEEQVHRRATRNVREESTQESEGGERRTRRRPHFFIATASSSQGEYELNLAEPKIERFCASGRAGAHTKASAGAAAPAACTFLEPKSNERK